MKPRWPWPGPVGGHAAPDRDEWLDRMAVRALYRIIMATILSIAALSLAGVLLRSVVLDSERLTLGTADEALSILGNIASAAIGGLVGWLTRASVARAAITPPDDSEGE